MIVFVCIGVGIVYVRAGAYGGQRRAALPGCSPQVRLTGDGDRSWISS